MAALEQFQKQGSIEIFDLKWHPQYDVHRLHGARTRVRGSLLRYVLVKLTRAGASRMGSRRVWFGNRMLGLGTWFALLHHITTTPTPTYIPFPSLPPRFPALRLPLPRPLPPLSSLPPLPSFSPSFARPLSTSSRAYARSQGRRRLLLPGLARRRLLPPRREIQVRHSDDRRQSREDAAA